MSQHEPVVSLYQVECTAVPTASLGDDLDPITFRCTSKTLPTFEDAETWNSLTDDKEQDIGLAIVGKIPKLKALEYEMEYDFDLMLKLVKYQKNRTRFDLHLVYDDTRYDTVKTATVKDNFLLNPADGGVQQNAGVGTMTVKFQPMGGKKIDDAIAVEESPRS